MKQALPRSHLRRSDFLPEKSRWNQQEETEQTETEELHLSSRSQQTSARGMLRSGSSEVILFIPRYLCYLLSKSTAVFRF